MVRFAGRVLLATVAGLLLVVALAASCSTDSGDAKPAIEAISSEIETIGPPPGAVETDRSIDKTCPESFTSGGAPGVRFEYSASSVDWAAFVDHYRPRLEELGWSYAGEEEGDGAGIQFKKTVDDTPSVIWLSHVTWPDEYLVISGWPEVDLC